MARQRKGRQSSAAGILVSEGATKHDVDGLSELDADELRARWRSVFGRRAPEHLTKSLMVRVLAYRIQVERSGDLSVSTIQLLEGSVRAQAEKAGSKIKLPSPGLSVGTMLVREYAGTRHHVKIVETGFAWNGTIYRSLTKVAHAITGTNWNGPRFFGLRDGTGGGI